MTTQETLLLVQKNLRAASCKSETAVREVLVAPVLQSLGWPTLDAEIVFREYPLGTRRVDYALFGAGKTPEVLIEVKATGNTGGADRQLFEYAFHQGVPLAIITDGREWTFYLPGERGDYAERQLYKLDLLERTADESAEQLLRYLEYQSVKSGDALETARKDFRSAVRAKEAISSIAPAWRELLEEPDATLMELVSKRVESICGVAPASAEVARFLETLPPIAVTICTPASSPPSKAPISQPIVVAAADRSGFEIGGRTYSAASATDAMIQILKLLAPRRPDFFNALAVRVRGRSRNHLATKKEDVYPDRPDLMHTVKELVPGWYIGTNIADREKRKIIEHACDVANLAFGSDVKIELSAR